MSFPPRAEHEARGEGSRGPTLGVTRDAERLLRNLGDWVASFREATRAPWGMQAVAQLFRYIALVTGREHCERFCASICAQVPETQDRARVEAADLEQLDRYAMRILTAATLDDVFADPS